MSRGNQADHNARPGRQAPLSGRQGAHQEKVRVTRMERPRDAIADARGLADKTVALA